MNEEIKTKRFTSRLPATPCTEELRNAIVREADVRKIKLAELQRYALQFFLSENAKLFGETRQENTQSKR